VEGEAVEGELRVERGRVGADGRGQGLTGGEALITLAGFVGGYAALLGIWTYLVRRLILRGPKPSGESETEVIAE